jgi:dimethylhistidine N-methyltransferase
LPETAPAGTATPAALIDLAPAVEDFRSHVLAGLAREPKALSSKFLYDARGSQLFEAICELPEYYPTRTELALLRDIGPELAELAGPGTSVLEYGSGAAEKIRRLLAALPGVRDYVPVDISRQHLVEQARTLAAEHPDVRVVPVCADFTAPLDLPAGTLRGRPLAFFPGSTIGNFEPDEIEALLGQIREQIGPDGLLVISVDLLKDEAVLLPAYDDAQGVTAAFNRNLLARINRELGADFDLEAFAHRVRYDAGRGRVEMHLESRREQTVTVAGTAFSFGAGETIHTESSHKFTRDGFRALAEGAGLRPLRAWTDAQGLFSIHLLAGR